MSSGTTKTYRVQGIPGAYTKEDCRKLLSAILPGERDNPEPTIHSLAADPSSSLGNRFQIATVTFRRDPIYIQDGQSEWLLPVTQLRSLSGKVMVSSITVDSHFLGFTPLNSVEDGSGHNIEWAPFFFKKNLSRSSPERTSLTELAALQSQVSAATRLARGSNEMDNTCG